VKLLVTGAAGLVGRAMVRHCKQEACDVIGLDHTALDITDHDQINHVFDRETPDAVINCAAWTDVDGCETDPERARLANAVGPELLALSCRRIRALLITISTDYVFDGQKDGFYDQRDQPNPQSVYGRSKLEGELRAQQAWARTMIVRSGYIFGEGGTNFLSTFLERALRAERVRAIRDCVGTPTYANDLAQRLFQLVKLDLPGIYHVVNSGEGASFETFVRDVFAAAGLDSQLIESIGANDLRRPAPRPRNSRLRCLLSPAVGLGALPLLDDAVGRFVGVNSGAESGGVTPLKPLFAP
jgi:dTDP-4-dehydrorhamnose reductase